MTAPTTEAAARGEQGIAIIMTSLCLIPLMVFAAFGVDLASWYSRISYLQKSADAAALAGTVWMPDINEATDGRVREPGEERHRAGPPDCGTGPFVVRVDRWLDGHVAPGDRDGPQRRPLLLPGRSVATSRSRAPPRPSTTCPSRSAAP